MFTTITDHDLACFSIDLLKVGDRQVLGPHQIAQHRQGILVWCYHSMVIWKRAWPYNAQSLKIILWGNLKGQLILLYRCLQYSQKLVLLAFFQTLYDWCLIKLNPFHIFHFHPLHNMHYWTLLRVPLKPTILHLTSGWSEDGIQLLLRGRIDLDIVNVEKLCHLSTQWLGQSISLCRLKCPCNGV